MTPTFANRVIALLVINKPPKFAHLAFESLLSNSNDLICVGFLNSEDISELPKTKQIRYVKLHNHEVSARFVDSKSYLAFDSNDFFYLVTFKWTLFKFLFESGVQQIVYTDLDVLWFSDISQQMERIHDKHPDSKVLIQDATVESDSPRLCMGLLSLKNCPEVRNLVEICHSLHLERVAKGHMYGDDDVITEYYQTEVGSSLIERLPQALYPVGIFLNLLRNNSPYGGLISSKPLIFHANYVVGASNKLVVMKIAKSLYLNKRQYGLLTLREQMGLRILNLKILILRVKKR
jgi:hypothetical protein